jgi:hypothetical protein
MNKLDVQHPSLTYPSDFPVVQLAEEIGSVSAELKPAGRLIVLIPPEADYALATKRLWKIAATTGMPIQLIGLCKEFAQEPGVRRELVTMAALIRDGRVCAEAKVEIGTDWVEVVKHNVQSGDLIVCFAEQRAGLFQKPLSQILQSNMKTSVYILSGLIPQNASQPNWFSQSLAWMGSIGIIAGSALVQFQITSLAQNWAQTALMIVSIIGEVGLIWGWNSLFS